MRPEPWWADEDERRQADAVCALVGTFRTDQTHRWRQLELAFCLYDDASGSDLTTNDFAFEIIEDEEGTPLNLVRSCVDTAQAEVIQSKPRPFFLPTGADWSVRRKCQQLTKFVGGVLAEEAWDRLAAALVIDMLLFGCGIAHPLVEDGQVVLDRVPPWELWCDPDEGRYGKPRCLYRTRYAHREVLAARYPDQADAIEQARSQLGRRRGRVSSDQVMVVDAWHLPSKKDEGDGVHLVCIEGAVLAKEDWPHDWFPFAMMPWKAPLQGMWSQGMASELAKVQAELNDATFDASTGRRIHAHTHILASKGSGLDVERMTDEPGKIWWYNGSQPPVALTFPGVSPETYAWIERTIQWGYQIASGVSASAARSEKSAGITSGRGIQMEANLQSRRFINAQRSFEQGHVDLGRTIVRVVEHAAVNDPGMEVVYKGKHNGERIKWSKARLDESGYMIRLDAVSSVPSSAAGRVDWLANLVGSGEAERMGVPPQMTARMMDAPDTEALQNFVTVAFDLVESMCERILDEGEDGWREPEGYFNLSVCFLVAIATYQEWRLHDAPEDRCEVLRDWIDAVRELMKREAQANAPPPAPPPNPAAPPGAAPAPPMGALCPKPRPPPPLPQRPASRPRRPLLSRPRPPPRPPRARSARRPPPPRARPRHQQRKSPRGSLRRRRCSTRRRSWRRRSRSARAPWRPRRRPS